jgi:uncharacterized membrane protein YraQ (UPF0718 family)
MGSGAVVAWLIGQLYDVPNVLSASRIPGWKIVITYAVLAFLSAVFSGLMYGHLVGSLCFEKF